tara:strand:+ start:107479 stop:107982 length:504 start_codon:yes stop_codon:yes gene_type:complete
MAFRKKLKLLLSILLTLSTSLYFILVNTHVDTHKLKGRIIKVEKKLGLEHWELILYSSGDIYKVDILNNSDVELLQNYEEKFILVNVHEYLIRGLFKQKYRLKSWHKVVTGKKVSGYSDRLFENVDKNLTCSLLAQLKSNKKLSEEVMEHLKGKDFDIGSTLEKCEI